MDTRSPICPGVNMSKKKLIRLENSSFDLCEAITTLVKGEDGEWFYEEKPAHQLVIKKFLDGLKSGVMLIVVPKKERKNGS